MKNIFLLGITMCIALWTVTSCDQDYIIGGEANPTNRFDMNTFDLLMSMEETKNVAILFEQAGMKDLINGDVTIFAPNQWSINKYLRRRNNQALRANPNALPVTIGDISAEELAQMGMYVFPGKLWRETIPAEGIELTALDGKTTAIISVNERNTDPITAWDGAGDPRWGYQYSRFMDTRPQMVHIHYKRGNNWEMTGEDRARLPDFWDNPECDHFYRMYVSDMLTNNGVVHILYAGDYNFSEQVHYHTLFFFGTRQDDIF